VLITKGNEMKKALIIIETIFAGAAVVALVIFVLVVRGLL